MKQVKIYDKTLCKDKEGFSFRESLEIAKYLDKLKVNVIEIPEMTDAKADALLVKTLGSFLKYSVVSVAAGSSIESIDYAAAALEQCENAIIRIELPMSDVGMEYSCHKKPAKMLEWIEKTVSYAAEKGKKVEFCALDATRAEKDFLVSAINTAVAAGATDVCVCDDAAEVLPDGFASFISEISADLKASLGVSCSNKNCMALSEAVLASKSGADFVKTVVGNCYVPFTEFVTVVKNCGNSYGIGCDVKYTELNRTVDRISAIASPEKANALGSAFNSDGDDVCLDENDSKETVIHYAEKLGYDLQDTDADRVYDEFLRVASKKKVGYKEIEAIIADNALQVPETYRLDTYAVNTGNTISPSAQIVLFKGDEALHGIGLGDGPIDAAFLTLEKMLGRHFELDDFQIQSVTEGKEAVGRAVVKLRNDGKLYSGSGISTDILGASIKAYISAVNKIVYEEEQ